MDWNIDRILERVEPALRYTSQVERRQCSRQIGGDGIARQPCLVRQLAMLWGYEVRMEEIDANTEADIFWEQWEWMKSFRLAGANRQIFETPENFLEPGVRDDKTQFFTELENELQQADMTQDTAETDLPHSEDEIIKLANSTLEPERQPQSSSAFTPSTTILPRYIFCLQAAPR